jgi:hypothetical protein
MVIKACVLRSGGDFRPHHVQWLSKQVPGLVCLSDVDVPGVQTIPLRTDWPGWWAKLEMFGPSLEGDVLMMDLDTVVLSLPAMPDRTTVLTDFYHPELINSSLMFVTAEDRSRVWEAFNRNPAGAMASCQKWPRWGDQGFLMDHLSGAQRWQDIAKVYSYKAHCTGRLPQGAEVVCFHGKPRPWDVRAEWIPPMNVDTIKKTLGDLVLKHKGERICVMGGGPSLASDLEKVKADVWISVNEHGARLRPADYVVAMDTVHTELKVDMRKHIRAVTDAPIIGPWGTCDYQILKWPLQPKFMLSGVVATWVASMMGAHPVILAGFDCYGGDAKTIEQHRLIAPHVLGEVRVCSGPLIGLHSEYRPSERRKAYEPPQALDVDKLREGEIVVRTAKPFQFRGQEWPKGTLLRVARHEVRYQIKHKSLIEV